MKNIIIVSATSKEIEPLTHYLSEYYDSNNDQFNTYKYKQLIIRTCITGVGSVKTVFKLGQLSGIENTDLAINAGIAGSFKELIPIGSVAEVIQDRFGDLGVENADGTFSDIFEAELDDPELFPFKNGVLTVIPYPQLTDLNKVSGITVQKVHGTKNSIRDIVRKYNPDIESMEGAAFFYVMKSLKINSTQIRAISNFVEPRNKNNWNIGLAIKNLNERLIIFLNQL
ncbi:MAG: futalosine hydrolase [Saprospiraceae bacterium]|nr:futalosine hydrolase [Saprospiraceae bacterium]